jgi:urease accessory protein
VIARARAVIEAGAVLRTLESQPPLTLRQVRSDDPDICALCIVASGAGPLAGDDLGLDLAVETGACVTLEAAGANLAQGRGSEVPGRLTASATVGAGGWLRACPGELIVCAGSRVDVRLDLRIAADAHVEWRELIVLGRTGEPSGSVRLRWDVTRAGRPLLRQGIDLTDQALVGWPGMVANQRVLASTLLVGPTVAARTIVLSPLAVAQKLTDNAVLLTVLGVDAALAGAELAKLRDLVQPVEESWTSSSDTSLSSAS